MGKLDSYLDKLYIKEEEIPTYKKDEEKEEDKEKEEGEEKKEDTEDEKPEEKKAEGEDNKEEAKEEKSEPEDDEKKKKTEAKELSKLTKNKVVTMLDNCTDKDLEDILYKVLDAKSALKKKKVDNLVKDKDDDKKVDEGKTEKDKPLKEEDKFEKKPAEEKAEEKPAEDKSEEKTCTEKEIKMKAYSKKKAIKKEEAVYDRIKDLAGVEPLKEKWGEEVDVDSTGEHKDKTLIQLKEEIKAIKEKKGKWSDVSGDKAKKEISERYFAIRAKKGWPKGKGSVKVDKKKK